MSVIYLIIDPFALLHDRNVVQVHFYICLCDFFVLLYIVPSCCFIPSPQLAFFLVLIASITPSQW